MKKLKIENNLDYSTIFLVNLYYAIGRSSDQRMQSFQPRQTKHGGAVFAIKE
jgi:hypothetical protein